MLYFDLLFKIMRGKGYTLSTKFTLSINIVIANEIKNVCL